MSFLDGKAIRDWCRETFHRKDDILETAEQVELNEDAGKTVDALVVKEVFQSVSDGKSLIASAITDKGVQTDASAVFADMARNIGMIEGSGGGDGGGGTCPVTSPYEFVLPWASMSVSSAGYLTQTVYFPVRKLKRLVVTKMYLWLQRIGSSNTIEVAFSIYGKKRGTESVTVVKSYSARVSGSTSSNLGANITDQEVDLSEWDEINYCVLTKSNYSGTLTYANLNLQFTAELYF